MVRNGFRPSVWLQKAPSLCAASCHTESQDSGYQPGGGKKTASGEVGYESFAKRGATGCPKLGVK